MANLLSKKIKQNILNFGPISVAEFMQQSLFDPEHGYYATKDPFGAEGDFITAPEISQIFGEVIAAYIIYYWQKIGKPKKFQIVELGPGRGSLMTDILRVSKTNSEFYAALSVTLIELSPKLRAVQRANLANFAVE
ncbi:MAG: SAM-dependent methyltransferase, partial [Rickettsiales bacterium]